MQVATEQGGAEQGDSVTEGGASLLNAVEGSTLFGLETHQILLIVFLAFAMMALVMWGMWLGGVGRFASAKGQTNSGAAEDGPENIKRALLALLINIIDDFRHLLALVILGVFMITLLLVLAAAWGDHDNMRDGLELVVASLGGLVGSIVGYYFGESAARKQQKPNAGDSGPPPMQAAPGSQDPSGDDSPGAASSRGGQIHRVMTKPPGLGPKMPQPEDDPNNEG